MGFKTRVKSADRDGAVVMCDDPTDVESARLQSIIFLSLTLSVCISVCLSR